MEQFGIDNYLDTDENFVSNEKLLYVSSNTSDNMDNIETIIKLEYEEDLPDKITEKNHTYCEQQFHSTLTEIVIDAENTCKSDTCLRNKTDEFKCNLCSKVLSRKSSLSRHTRAHNDEKAYTCKRCGKRFFRRDNLLRHTSNKVQCKEPHTVKVCSRTFTGKCFFTNHTREHDEENVEICGEVFTSRESLRLHSDTHKNTNGNPSARGGSTEYLLYYTSNTWLFGEQLLDSSDISNLLKDTIEKKANAKFMNSDAYLSKMITEPEMVNENNTAMLSGDNTNANSGCGEDFVNSRIGNIDNNTNVNSGCGEDFVDSRIGNIDNNTNVNSGCGEDFVDSRIRNIDSARQCKTVHMCLVCDKKFSRKSSLLRHSGTHSNKKPFTCSFCTKSFARDDALIRHERNHTSRRKEVKCKLCGKFVTRMKKHMALHARGKPYMCKICHATFFFKSELTHHERSHSGGQVHKCDVCSKLFTRISSLERHKEIHMNPNMDESAFKCNGCEKRFRRKWSLVQHLAKESC